MTNGNDVLMGGGSGHPAWAFDEPGTRKRATVAAPPTSRQEREYVPGKPGAGKPLTFPSGDPIMGVLVDMQTDERRPDIEGDDGRRTFFIEGKRLKEAVRDAVRAAGAPGLEVGGVLDVTLTHYDTPGDRRSGRNWQIVYTPPGNAALMGDAGAATEADPWATAGDQGQGSWGAPAPQAQAPHYQQPPTSQVYAAPPVQPAAPQPATGPVAAAAGQMSPQALAEFEAWQRAQQGRTVAGAADQVGQG